MSANGVPWYAEGVLDANDSWDRICAAMRVQAAEWRDEPAAFAGFARWVREDALSQELFGEAIEADPSLLDVAVYAFMAGRDVRYRDTPAPAQPSGAAGGVVVASHGADPPAAGTAVPAPPPAAPAGVPHAPAGVGPTDVEVTD